MSIYMWRELGPWTYHNPVEGLISFSTDWITWYTIADKNLWATTVYNDWDVLSEANCGKYYQWWNNYGFPFTWPVTTSSTQVNAGTYWPWNYYSSNKFITRSELPYWWDSSNNTNLWWNTTDTFVARQWPCDVGYHVPSKDESVSLVAVMTALWIDTSNWNCMKTYLKMPFAGYRDSRTAGVSHQGTSANYWSSTASFNDGAYNMYFNSAEFYPQGGGVRSYGFSIRPFKNTAVQPDDSWTVLYQPS